MPVGPAEDACLNLHGYLLDGHHLWVNVPQRMGVGYRGSGEVKIYVDNLTSNTAPDSAKTLFEQHGPVMDFFMPTNPNSGAGLGL
jgi:RNA recognition motif. (a.k.a. RRM, RBD, or RNP domain)